MQNQMKRRMKRVRMNRRGSNISPEQITRMHDAQARFEKILDEIRPFLGRGTIRRRRRTGRWKALRLK